jgi:hypothetical protein
MGRLMLVVGALLVMSGCAVSPLSPSVSAGLPQAGHILVPVALDRGATPSPVISAPPVVVSPVPAAPAPPAPPPVVVAPQTPPPSPVIVPAPGVPTPGQVVPPAPVVLPPGFNPTPSPICGFGVPRNAPGCVPPPCPPGVTCGVPEPIPPGTPGFTG